MTQNTADSIECPRCGSEAWGERTWGERPHYDCGPCNIRWVSRNLHVSRICERCGERLVYALSLATGAGTAVGFALGYLSGGGVL